MRSGLLGPWCRVGKPPGSLRLFTSPTLIPRTLPTKTESRVGLYRPRPSLGSDSTDQNRVPGRTLPTAAESRVGLCRPARRLGYGITNDIQSIHRTLPTETESRDKLPLPPSIIPRTLPSSRIIPRTLPTGSRALPSGLPPLPRTLPTKHRTLPTRLGLSTGLYRLYK